MSGLTTLPGDTCTNGVAGTPGNSFTVIGGQITIYTCSASEFVVYENNVSSGGGGSGSSGGGGSISRPTSGGGGGGGGGSSSNDDEDTTTDEDTTADNGVDANISGTDAVDTIRNEGSCAFSGFTPSYGDTDNSWARSYIRDLSQRGIMNGVGATAANPGGSFQPERAITRAEFLKIATKSFCYDYSQLTGTENFDDVENGSWVARVTELAGALGVINTTNTNFRPNDPISKIEAMKIILLIAETRSTNFTVDDSVTTTIFPDVTTLWMMKYAEKADELGTIDGNNGFFEPTIAISRAQTSKIAVRTMNAQ